MCPVCRMLRHPANRTHISTYLKMCLSEIRGFCLHTRFLTYYVITYVTCFQVRHVLTCKFRTIILPVVVYRCETWSLKLRKERRLSVFENRVLRRVFGATKRDEVTKWELRILHNEELYNFYSSPIIFRVIKSRRTGWTGHVARIGERRGV